MYLKACYTMLDFIIVYARIRACICTLSSSKAAISLTNIN